MPAKPTFSLSTFTFIKRLFIESVTKICPKIGCNNLSVIMSKKEKDRILKIKIAIIVPLYFLKDEMS